MSLNTGSFRRKFNSISWYVAAVEPKGSIAYPVLSELREYIERELLRCASCEHFRYCEQINSDLRTGLLSLSSV